MTAYHTLAVGEPFDASRASLYEGSRLAVAGSTVVFATFRPDPDADMADAVRSGRCEFFLWSRHGQVAVCLHCRSPRGELWAHAPFEDGCFADADGPAAPRPLRADEPVFGEAIVVLVNASDGLVAAIRAVSLSDRFMRALIAAIHRRASAPRGLQGLHARHARPEELARDCEVRCEGRD